jgi:hypothetical protein
LLEQSVGLFNREVCFGCFRLTDDVESAAEDFLDNNNRNRLLNDRNLGDPVGVGRVARQNFRQNVGVERFNSRTSASRSW